ncbi:hypothetical protein ACFFRR_009010 [Megaselia abdita]
MEICIIGGGMAGICSAKHALDHGLKVTVFEKTGNLGGTWVYNDKSGTDEYGLDIHSSMYKSLHTNLPKETMTFPGYPYDFKEQETSFVSHFEISAYLNHYAEINGLPNIVKFHHNVIRVNPLRNKKWEILVHDLVQDKYNSYTFDYVMVCNGHYFAPAFSKIEDIEDFKGRITHSHDYRDSSSFKDETVLVIGVGPSGMDLAFETSKVAKKVLVSHHLKENLKSGFAQHVIQKPDCVRIRNGNYVEFVDGSEEYVSVILFCTGYEHLFPFLSVDTGITARNNYVKPLYKHCINIRHPTMAFIGLPYIACVTLMMDIQVRFVLKYFSGLKQLPSKEEMLEDTRKDMESRRSRGLREKEAHLLGPVQGEYYEDLARTAEIKNIPAVVLKIYDDNRKNMLEDFLNFRKNLFKIYNDEEYEKIVSSK